MKKMDFNIIDVKNYNKKFKKGLKFYIKEYNVLMKEFIDYFDKYIKYNNIKKHNIVYKGIESITHIFILLLLYTKNLSLTLYHCKKSFLYYVEFISQIGDEGNSYLQLNTKDAILFIYKKSIFEIDNTYRINMDKDDDNLELMSEIKKFTCIFKEMYFFIIRKIIIENDKKQKNINLYKLLDLLIKKKEKDEYLFDKVLEFINILNLKNIDINIYLSGIRMLVKKKNFIMLSNNEFKENLKKNIFNEITYNKYIDNITK